jgi:hypothetical protein
VDTFCEQNKHEHHAIYPNADWDEIWFFHLIKPKDVDNRASWDCKKIEGCHSMHSVASISH